MNCLMGNHTTNYFPIQERTGGQKQDTKTVHGEVKVFSRRHVNDSWDYLEVYDLAVVGASPGRYVTLKWTWVSPQGRKVGSNVVLRSEKKS